MQNSETSIKFISSKDVEEECVMHSSSDNIKFILMNSLNNFVQDFK